MRGGVEASIGKVSLKARELSHRGSMALVSAETSIDLLGIRHGELTQLTAGSISLGTGGFLASSTSAMGSVP